MLLKVRFSRKAVVTITENECVGGGDGQLLALPADGGVGGGHGQLLALPAAGGGGGGW